MENVRTREKVRIAGTNTKQTATRDEKARAHAAHDILGVKMLVHNKNWIGITLASSILAQLKKN